MQYAADACLLQEMYRTAEEEPPQGYEFDLDTPQREEFVKLLEENELEPDKHPKQKMCQALFNRAYMLVPKIMKIEADHVGLSVAKSNNLVGENVWEEYQFAKECMNEEIAAIQEAANELQAGWAPSIVGEAVRNYMNNNKEEGEKRVRDVLKAHGKDVPAAEPAAAAAAPAAAPQSKAVASPQQGPPSPQGGGEAGKEGVQIKAGGQGRVDCYGQSHPEFKAMLREKFVPTANAQQLKFFLMFNDPKMMNIEENTAGWSEEKFKEATLELLDIKDLAILCIPPQYWVDEVDNSRDDNFFAQGGKLMEAQKFQEAFQFFMGALAQMQNNVELWRATANVLLMTGQFQNGVVHLLEVIRRIRNCDPRKPDLLFNLASCLGNMGGEGSLEASKLVLSHALALDPAHKLSLDAIAKVDQGIAQAKLAAA